MALSTTILHTYSDKYPPKLTTSPLRILYQTLVKLNIEMTFGPDIDHFPRLPTRLMELIFSKVMGSGHYLDIKFLCRCFLVSKCFYKAIRDMSNISINHYCVEELHDFMPKVLQTFKFVRYLYVHHGSPPSLNKFNWKVTLQPVGINFLYGMTALSYNSIQKRSRDDEEDVYIYPLRLAPHDTRIQCMSTERYVMQMSKLHDMLMLCVRSLDCIVSVHVTDFGNHGSLVIDGLLLQCMRSSVYDSKKAKRDKLAWFVGGLVIDEFVMSDITANIILKWKDDPFQNCPFDTTTNYDRILSYFNLQKSEMVYDKALLSILQQHKNSGNVQRGYNNKLVYPDSYESIFKAPLPVTGIYSKGSLTFGIGLKYDPSPYFAQLLPKPNKRKQIWRNDCIKEMYSEDSNVQLRGTRRLAELLEADRRLGDLRSEDVRLLIGLLGHGEKPELQFYGALALTYVDSDGAEIIREEAIPSLVGLMISKHARTQMRGMLILMRLAYDFPKSVRDLHKFGVLELLKDMVYSHRRNYYELLNCATFLAIVCRAKSNLQACEIRVACHTAKLLLQYGDDEVKPQTLLALSYLSNGSCIPLKQFPRRYVLKLIKRHVDPSIVILTLQVVGNIMAWGGYDQKKFMLTKGLLKRLHRLKLPQYKILRYEACRIIQIIEKERQIINLPLGTFKIHKLEGTDICSIIENEKGEKINFAEHDDDFLKSLPIKVQSNSLDMSSFMPLLLEEEVTTKFLELKWMAEYYTPNEFPSYLATR
ncbi:hypothetical protein POM88_000141 [Heracleum sosnowskyi]|uniref:F-box domain-containing protein n=1 Tax=Heracleum sosnowskyi TaxID=360622 RepID=A0AAD8JB76_9APIA|nr:hypothetical protein POM88_000141 [Heracleum sosnowskyi]